MFPTVISLVHQFRTNGHILAAMRFDTEDADFLNQDDHDHYKEFIWQDEFSEQQREDVSLSFCHFIGDAILVGHEPKENLTKLLPRLSNRSHPVLDTAVLARVFFPRQKHYTLESLWKALNPESFPLTSARELTGAVGYIFTQCRQKARTYDPGYYIRVEPVVRSTVYQDFFAQLKEDALNKAPDKPIMTGLFAQTELTGTKTGKTGTRSEGNPYDVPKDFQWAASCFARDGLIARSLPGFESRKAQAVMSQRIVDAFDTGNHMVIEAGTGTGKSMAYLLPALWWAKLMGEKVVVATHTIPLQEQLFTKDLPFLAGVLPFSFKAALLKGRNNYICPLLLEQEIPQEKGLTPVADDFMPASAVSDPAAGQDGVGVMVWPMLLSWLRETESGDFGELPQLPQWNHLWQRLNADTAQCMPGRCRHAKECPMLKARQRAQEADMIVINHSLLFADVKMGMLPAYQYLVVDEAHNLYASALSHLGFEVSYERLSRWHDKWRRSGRGSSYAVWLEVSRSLRDLFPAEEYGRFTDNLSQCPFLADRIEEQAQETFGLFRQILGGRFSMRLTLESLSLSVQNLLKVELENLGGRLEEMDKTFQSMQLSLESSRQLDTLKYEIIRERAQLAEWVQGLRQTAAFHDNQYITYLEKSSILWLRSAPLDIAGILREDLFTQKEAVILCSATLSVAGDFGYFLREIGLNHETETLVLKSHFNYDSQMLSCIVSGFARGGDEEVLARDVATFVGEAARMAGGHTLVLFTSHRLLRLVNNALEILAEEDVLGEGTLGILAQGIHGGRDALLDEFRANPQRVLLGSSSFWEGIDLPKDQLSCLIMVRLPFWPPSMPVIEARSELMVKKGQDPFNHLLLPEAVIRFKQGFGRLLRTRDDKGVFILLDDRLITKSYGLSFLRSLPKRTHVRGTRQQVLRKVGEFFKNMNKD